MITDEAGVSEDPRGRSDAELEDARHRFITMRQAAAEKLMNVDEIIGAIETEQRRRWVTRAGAENKQPLDYEPIGPNESAGEYLDRVGQAAQVTPPRSIPELTEHVGRENLREYRASVIAQVACPACLAERNERCVRLPELGDATIQPGWVEYVHDDRSFAHYMLQLRPG